MKKKTLFTSILTIVMCLSLTVGATFALFTSSSAVNIAVTSATVKVIANIDETSVQTKQLYDTEYTKGANNMFESKATFADNGLTLEKFVPGDGIKFDIVVKNESDVTVKYRTIISCENDTGLFAGLKINIGEHSNYNSVKAVSSWKELLVGSANEIVSVEIELPENAGDEYQNKTCTISYVVEAVQGNADTVDVDGSGKTTAPKSVADDSGNSATIPVNTAIRSGNLGLTLEIEDLDEEETPATVNTGLFELASDGGEAYAYNVNIPEVSKDNETAIVITMKVKKGLEGEVLLFHEGIPMTLVASVEAVDEHDEFYYDAENGVVTFATKNFSNFTLATGFSNVAVVSSTTTFAEIANYIADGKNIYVTENIDLTDPASGNTYITVDNHIVFYLLEGVSISFNEVALVNGTGSITVCGGSIKTNYELCITGNATMIFEGGEHSFGAFSATSNGTIIVNDGTLNCYGSYAKVLGISFAENGTLIVNGGTLNMYQPFNLNANRCDKAYIEINGGFIHLMEAADKLFAVRNIMDKDKESGVLRGSKIRINGGVFVADFPCDNTGDANAFIRNEDGNCDTTRVLTSNTYNGRPDYDCLVSGGTFYGDWKRTGETGGDGTEVCENTIAGFIADGYEIIGDAVNGYEINDTGIGANTTLWGNKNSMGKDKLSVTVDGEKVY